MAAQNCICPESLADRWSDALLPGRIWVNPFSFQVRVEPDHIRFPLGFRGDGVCTCSRGVAPHSLGAASSQLYPVSFSGSWLKQPTLESHQWLVLLSPLLLWRQSGLRE